MFIVKIDKMKLGEESSLKIFGRNILEHIKSKFRNDKISIIDDSRGFELITSGPSDVSDSSTIELTFKKTITLKPNELDDKNSLDRVLSEIKDFCDQSAKINNYEYRLITMRGSKDGIDRTGITSGN